MVWVVGCGTIIATSGHRQRQQIPQRISDCVESSPNTNTSMEAQNTKNIPTLTGVPQLARSHGNKGRGQKMEESG
jgi:hypothetical protein